MKLSNAFNYWPQIVPLVSGMCLYRRVELDRQPEVPIFREPRDRIGASCTNKG